MPNWCENRLVLKHDDPAMLDKALEAWNSGSFLQTIIPCPQELMDTVSGSVGRLGGNPSVNYRVELHEAKEKLNIKYFGFKNWYEWCVVNWGTKWDIGHDQAESKVAEIIDGEIDVHFNSAWSPPIRAYEKLSEMGYKIKAYYYEPGADFCGEWIEGEDELFTTTREAPKHLDEMFGISETIENMED